MDERLTAADIRYFNLYLANCSDAQVVGVYEKEHNAGRDAYAELAKAEGRKRNISLGRSR